MAKSITFAEVVVSLHKGGLGELLTLHRTKSQIFIGNMIYDKGRLQVRDRGLLSDLKPAQLDPCWESGAIGMVCRSYGHSWDSLTFYGLENCALPVDLGKTRHGALSAAENQYGDRLIDFVGSVYRGYNLMLENHFLPVVLLQPIKSKKGEPGLVVADLRAAALAISTIRSVNDVVRRSVEKYLALDVEDIDMSDEKFEELFAGYLKKS